MTGRLEQRSWETEQGEKRSVVEIVADDVAPSLRFATAEVHQRRAQRPERRRRRWRRRARARSRRAGGGAPATANYDDYGEEPF